MFLIDMHAWIFKSNDTCACVANLNRNCPHTYIYGKLGTLAKYQCWDKTDKTGISTGQSVSVSQWLSSVTLGSHRMCKALFY